jgi:hypothetical protein
MKNQIAFLLATAGLVALASRCDSGSSDCTQTSTCAVEAGPDAPMLSCDTTKDPKDDPGCVDDRVGIFVSAQGSAGNAGTKEAPVQTIAQALALTTTLKRIYVCAGTYAEDVALGATADGVSIYGGFACSDWSYTGNNVTFGNGSIALTISGTTKPLSIEDVKIQAADGAGTNASSIAALVANASGAVTFARVSFNAGKGVDGGDGGATSNYSGSAPTGNNASGNAGGALQQCAGTCTDTMVSTGGQGGAGGGAPSGGSAGAPALGGGAAGIAGDACNGTGSGGDGTGASAPGADATSPTTVGTLASTGWTATIASNGKNGSPGQGGGGGAGTSQGGGAGGACGGCGGGGGNGGTPGGASIALAVIASTVVVNGSDLHTSTGGNGGKGGAGQLGQSGGSHGSGAGCGAGNGGNGSAGGTGAGGVGGISVGVLYSGPQPTLDSATTAAITVSTAGTKGVGGIPGTNDGIDGVAQPVLQAP